MEVKELKDIHKNKLCFLIGAGPSLHFIDRERLKPYINIAVNSGVVGCKWCDYFISDDIGVKNWHYYTDLLPKLKCIKLLYRDKLEKHCSHLDDVILFSHTWWFSPSEKKHNMEGLLLTQGEPIVGARTSMGSAVHIAYIMGCDPIVLLGNDCKFKDFNRYFWQYAGEEKTNRITGRKFTPGNQSMGFDQDSFIEYWNCFAKVNKDILGKEVEIIDASDSALKCFPKMNIDKVLKKYGGRKNGI